jgi:hypothetical protein
MVARCGFEGDVTVLGYAALTLFGVLNPVTTFDVHDAKTVVVGTALIAG